MDVFIVKLRALELQSGIDDPQRGGDKYIYNPWRDKEADEIESLLPVSAFRNVNNVNWFYTLCRMGY